MICWKCGHDAEAHEKEGSPSTGCWICHRWKVPKINNFWDHKFEDNLSFIERKAREKKLG